MNDSQYARDKDGNIIRDRYGRPVPKRPRRPRQNTVNSANSSESSNRPPRQDAPRQREWRVETVDERRLRLAREARAEWERKQQQRAQGNDQQSPRNQQSPHRQYNQQHQNPSSAAPKHSVAPQPLQSPYGRNGRLHRGEAQPQQPRLVQPPQSSGTAYLPNAAEGEYLPPQQSHSLQRPASPPINPPQPPRQPKQPKQPRTRRAPKGGCVGRGIKRVIQALILVVILVFGLGIWADTKLTRIDAIPPHQAAKGSGTNWLLVGSDSRQGLTEDDVQRLGTGGDIGVGRTDTIMLLHIPTTGEPTLLSIPRDSYVNIDGVGMDKINAAFAVGGPQLLVQTVEQSTGLRVNHYAEIGFGGFAGMVDAIGGVKLCPNDPIDDPLANLNVQAGCQKMDGATALGYVRTRATPMGDLDRVKRQREFFASLVGKVTSPSVFLNPFRFFPLISNAAGSFTVNDSDHVWNLARLAMAVSGGIKMETIPVGGFQDTDVGNVLLWDEPAAQEMFEQLR